MGPALFLGLASAVPGFSQTDSTNLLTEDTNASASAVVTSNVPAARPQNRLNRWLDLNTLSTSLRYRSTANTNGIHMFNFGQHREIIDGRFKLDGQGKYTVNFHVSSGRYFYWAYADTIGGQFADRIPDATSTLKLPDLMAVVKAIHDDPQGLKYASGIASRGGYMYFRQLYAVASPVPQLALEFGSLPIERGVNTEITSFDEDGYIAGERLRLRSPKHLYFDEVAVTSAYLGDPFTANFFARGQRLGESNYQQYLVRKKFNDRIVASTDYTHLRGTHTVREAVAFKLPTRIVDNVRGEFYQRLNDISLFGVKAQAASGFGLSVSKNFKGGFNTEAGYASVDNAYAVYSGSSFLLAVKLAWNSDTFMNGKHPYARVNWKIAPGLTLNGLYTHVIGVNSYGVSGQTLNAGFTYDIADLLHHTKVM